VGSCTFPSKPYIIGVLYETQEVFTKRITTTMAHHTHIVDDGGQGERLDRFLTDRAATVSRAELQRAIRDGLVTVDGALCRQPSRRLREGETITWTHIEQPPLTPRPLPIPILFEDEDLVVVDKPEGLVVHPGAGTSAVTLVEAVLHDRRLAPSDDPRRPGMVHRLDKDTSGVIVLAKTAVALASLKGQFADRSVRKLYIAVVGGVIEEDEGLIDAPILRDPKHPRRMGIGSSGRPSQTAFRVLRRESGSTLLLVRPITGRTHQVRVHFHHIGHPVVGDPLYGRPATRLLLHAFRLWVDHPATGERCRFEASVPEAFPAHDYAALDGSSLR